MAINNLNSVKIHIQNYLHNYTMLTDPVQMAQAKRECEAVLDKAIKYLHENPPAITADGAWLSKGDEVWHASSPMPGSVSHQDLTDPEKWVAWIYVPYSGGARRQRVAVSECYSTAEAAKASSK